MRAANRLRVDVGLAHCGLVHRALGHEDLAHPLNPSHDLHPVALPKKLLGDGPSRHSRHGLPGRSPPSPARWTEAIFLFGGEVGVRRAVEIGEISISPRSRVLVADKKGYRCTQGHAALQTREDLDGIVFLTLRYE